MEAILKTSMDRLVPITRAVMEYRRAEKRSGKKNSVHAKLIVASIFTECDGTSSSDRRKRLPNHQ